MPTVAEALAAALDHHRSGRLQAAEQIYRQILAADPNQPNAHQLLGVVALQAGRPDMAVQHISDAIRLNGANADFHRSLGQAYRACGRLHDAIASFQTAVQISPQHPQFQLDLAAALKDAGQIDQAIVCCHTALNLQPNNADIHLDLGNLFRISNRPDDAIACYRRALQLNPNLHHAWNNLGVVSVDQNRLDEAIACFERAVELAPGAADLQMNLAAAMRNRGKLEQAVVCYRRLLQMKPNLADAWNELGKTLADQGKVDEAIVCYGHSLAIRPDYPEAHMHLGMALRAKGNMNAAVDSYRRALQLRPNYAVAYSNLGRTLTDMGKPDESVPCCQRAIELKPGLAEAHHNLGNALADLGRPQEAIESYRRAIAIKPQLEEAHFALSVVQLLTCDFEQGWREYEWRWRRTESPPRDFAQPQWDGGDLAGRTILLHTEQGCGDAIQFIRYAPLVAARGGRVIVECQGELYRLFQSVKGVEQIIARGGPLPQFDLHCPLLTLPLVLGTTLANIPDRVPYLTADAGLCQRWRERLASDPNRLKVGVTWAGNPKMKGDRIRSMPISALAPLAEVAGVSFYSLQKGEGAKQIKDTPAGLKLIDFTDDLHDFADTAAFMSQLDLVISVCTSVAHLAGALGRPAWTVLAFAADWRWLQQREDSPWYPTMRLFRQSGHGDWGGVIERVREALNAWHGLPARGVM